MPRFVFVLILGLCLPVSILAEEYSLAWTNPEHWEILGSIRHEVRQLRDALAADIDVLLASRAPVDPEALSTLLAERLAAGYRHSGFPEAVVTSELVKERQRIALTVKEGPYYRNGDVRVDGAVTIPVEDLLQGLTDGTGPKDAFPRWTRPREQGGEIEWYKPNGEKVAKESAVWTRDQSTRFDSHLEKSVAETAVRILQRCGYMDPTVTARLEPQANGKTTLVVNIDEEGPRATLGEIEVHGNERNTADEILTYLDVKPGQPLDSDIAARWKWALQESARFYETKVEITAPPFGPGPSRLDIHVVEIPDLPTLREPATPIMQASVRAARWMTAPKKEDWQLGVAVKVEQALSAYLPPAWDGADSLNLQWTLSAADRAMILELNVFDARQQSIWALHIHFDQGELQLVNLARRAKMTLPAIDGKLIAILQWDVRKPDEHGRSELFNFNIGMNSSGGSEARPPEIKPIVNPAALLIHGRKSELTTTLDDGNLRMAAEGTLIEFDAETGQLRHFESEDVATGSFRLRADTGLYQQRFKELTPEYAACREQLAPTAKISSVCRFFIDEWSELGFPQSRRQEESLALVRRLLDAGVLRSLDEALSADEPTETVANSDFEIPAPPPSGPLHPLSWLKPVLHMAFAGYSKVFPRDTGAWVAGREATLALVGGRKGPLPPGRVVDLLDEAESGPLSFLLATELFHFVSPYHQFVLSNATLDRLDSQALRSELRVLTDERSVAGKVVLAVATALRDAAPDDLAMVSSWVTKSQFDDVLHPAFQELSRRKDEPLSRVLPDVLAQIYPALIRPLLVAELQRLDAPLRAANAQQNGKPK